MALVVSLDRGQALVVNGVRVMWKPGRKLLIFDKADLQKVVVPPKDATE